MRVVVVLIFAVALAAAAGRDKSGPEFQTSDRCIACHNGLTTSTGQDVSIGFDWRASIMANSSRDPYWQASARRETIDHPESRAEVEDECSVCHMPVTRYQAKLRGELGQIFAHLPFAADKKAGAEAEDGVTCSICHQVGTEKLGTRESFNGGFVVNAPAGKQDHPEYGPFDIRPGHQRIMQTSTGGFVPTDALHIRDSKLCATCHTLYTTARGAGGKVIGQLPEQMPYLEWLHSDYRDKQSCQECHMPEVAEATPITRVLGVPRQGLHQHVFVGDNFFMQRMLNRWREELSVEALPQELTSAADGTVAFLQSRAARVRVEHVEVSGGRLRADVFVENLTGHKLPTAFPSRRAWLHVTVRDANRRVVFESGAVRPDGSIVGNDNDADPSKFEPHYSEIDSPDQVEIYEDILGDQAGHVTTGLLTGINYLKDNRLLPYGFDKATAEKDVAVIGGAAQDPEFTGAGDRVRYSVALNGAAGPFEVTAELWYQPIGFRWANNLKPYDSASEPRRFNSYYDAMGPATALVLAHAAAQGR
ncbi:MAG TPA: hypothetical protein VFA04_23395 [Bryobacteraceae bacterium]|nr:hypothetical protein [Bryobacteraceae bacterium]